MLKRMGTIPKWLNPTRSSSSPQSAADTLETMSTQEWLDDLANRVDKTEEPFDVRLRRYIAGFTCSVDQLRKMTSSFVHELEVGLACHKAHPNVFVPEECSFKMLDTHVPVLPNGKESGVFYALDFGGTNFRVVRCELDGKGGMSVKQRQRSLLEARTSERAPNGLLDPKATASEMFDFFAGVVKEFMEEVNDNGANTDPDAEPQLSCGFTFSYPCSQSRVDSATLMCWTKGFETGRATDDPVEARDVAELINVAFLRNDVPMRCNSVLNDTVGTLLACAYEMRADPTSADLPQCLVGLIMGTGLNAAYWDPAAQSRYGYSGGIINVECGNFNRDLPRTNVDCELDFRTVANRGLQHLEKMCSGAYLGEIARGVILKVFQRSAPAMAWQMGSFSTAAVARCSNDESDGWQDTCKCILECWNVQMVPRHCQAIHQICRAVLDRAAALASVIVAACAIKTGRLQPALGGVTVAVDGSLYKLNEWVQNRMEEHLVNNLGANRAGLIRMMCADDGSGKGAAVLAATTATAMIA